MSLKPRREPSCLGRADVLRGALLRLGLAALLLAPLSWSGAARADAPQAGLEEAERLLRRGDAATALARYELVLTAEGLAPRAAAQAEGGAGLALTALGRPLEARRRLEKSQSLATSIGAADVAATSAYNRGLALLTPPRRSAAPAPLAPPPENASVELVTRSGARGAGGVSLALVLRAANTFAEAGGLASEGGRSALAARSYAAAVRTRLRTGRALQIAPAREELLAAAAALNAIPPGSARLETALAVGEAGLALLEATAPEPQPSAQRATFAALSLALEEAGRAEDARLESYARGGLGGLYGLAGRTEEAITLSEQAVALAEQSGADEALFRWRGQLGRWLAAAERTAEALAAYRAAAADIQYIRPALAASARDGGLSGGLSSREQVEPILLDYADLLLRRGSAAEILRARSVLDQLKTIELEQFFEEMCVAGTYGGEAALDQVGAATAILYPVVFEERVDLIVTTSGGAVERRSVEITRAELADQVGRVLEDLTRPDGGPGPLEGLGALYDIFVRPVEQLLESEATRTLVFAPDGILRGVPLAAFHDGERFLVERYAVGSTLSLSLVDPQPFAAVRPRGVIAGVTEALTVERGGRPTPFSELAAVEAELAAVGEVVSGPTLLNESFTRQGLSEALDDEAPSIVHIASHATFGANEDDSYILAYGGAPGAGAAIALEDLGAFAGSARVRGEPIELLTLSACDTGVGRLRGESDQAILGLAGVALRSGARSVLASLWPVFDESTSALMPRFYQALLNERSEEGAPLSKAEALQRAQLALLAEEETRHPAFWAAFVLVGNWL